MPAKSPHPLQRQLEYVVRVSVNKEIKRSRLAISESWGRGGGQNIRGLGWGCLVMGRGAHTAMTGYVGLRSRRNGHVKSYRCCLGSGGAAAIALRAACCGIPNKR